MPPSGVDYASEFLNGYAPEYVLENHYKNTYKVKDVFLNNGGTVTIDCRK